MHVKADTVFCYYDGSLHFPIPFSISNDSAAGPQKALRPLMLSVRGGSSLSDNGAVYFMSFFNCLEKIGFI